MTLVLDLRNELTEYGFAAARILLALVFLYSGLDKLRHWRSSVAEVVEIGLPFPGLFTAATIVTQIVGGVSVASGFAAPIGAGLLAGFTIVATLLGHKFWLLHGDQARREFTTSLEHVAIVGGLLMVIVEGLAMGAQ